EADTSEVLGVSSEISGLRGELSGTQGLEGLLGLTKLRGECCDPVRQLVSRGLERGRQTGHEGTLARLVPVGIHTDIRLHAADAGADRRLAEQADRADLRRGGHVGAAAELHRERSADFHYPDVRAVVLA